MLSLILGFVTGLSGPITSIVNRIADLKQAEVQAKNNSELASIKASLEEAQGRKAVLLAESGNRISGLLNAFMRASMAIGPAAFLCKVFLWDKVIGSFVGCAGEGTRDLLHCTTHRTDVLDPNLWSVVLAVIGFYFLYDITAKFRK